MAKGIPKTIESEIYDILNDSIYSGTSLQEFELQQLIYKARTLLEPVKSACLTALYSHSFKYDLAAESAKNCFRSQSLDQSCVENTISALSNARMFSEVIELSKKYPLILDFPRSRTDSYEAALYLLDLKYCQYILDNCHLELSGVNFTHENIMNFFEHDFQLINRASKYFKYIFSALKKVLNTHRVRSSSLALGFIQSAYGSSLELAIYIKDKSFEDIMALESDWLDGISLYEVSDEILCDISFVIGEAK